MKIKKTINPFLKFNGNCREAIEYYKNIFNGNIEMLMFAKGKFAEATEFTSGFASENLILHSILSFYDNFIIMASDTRIGKEVQFGNSNFVVINFTSEEEIERVYNLFAKDAITIIEPLHKPFWNAKYAEFVDKFGVCWMFNFDYQA